MFSRLSCATSRDKVCPKPLHPSTHLQILSENISKEYSYIYRCHPMIHEIFWVFRMQFEALSPHLCCGQQQTSSFAKPAILWQLILVIRPLSRFYRTFRITIQFYSEELRRCLGIQKKNTKFEFRLHVQIQTHWTP